MAAGPKATITGAATHGTAAAVTADGAADPKGVRVDVEALHVQARAKALAEYQRDRLASMATKAREPWLARFLRSWRG